MRSSTVQDEAKPHPYMETNDEWRIDGNKVTQDQQIRSSLKSNCTQYTAYTHKVDLRAKSAE